MWRVAIIGCGGAGKTALALEVVRILDLPIVHIDVHNWRGSVVSLRSRREIDAYVGRLRVARAAPVSHL